MERVKLREGDGDTVMEFTKDINEADGVLTPIGVLAMVLGDLPAAIACMEALDSYAHSLEYGNNQAPVVIFMPDYVAFGCVDLWEDTNGGVM